MATLTEISRIMVYTTGISQGEFRRFGDATLGLLREEGTQLEFLARRNDTEEEITAVFHLRVGITASYSAYGYNPYNRERPFIIEVKLASDTADVMPIAERLKSLDRLFTSK